MTTPVNIDYTSRDYLGLRQSLLDYAERNFPEWTDRSEGDFGVALVELMAYMGDIISYYQDRTSSEAYIGSAVQRKSVLDIAQLLAYKPTNAVAATGTVTFVSDATTTADIVVPAGTQVVTDFVTAYDSPIFYETVADVTVPQAGGTFTATVVEGQTQGSNPITINQNTPYVETVVVEDLGISDGTEDQNLQISKKPVVEGTIRIFSNELDVNNRTIYVEWQKFQDLIDATSVDKAFSTFTDEFNYTYILFGDNVSGKIPANLANLYVHYRLGGGAKGNIAANNIIDIAQNIPGVSIQSSSAMTGGADPETTNQIRNNAPLAFRTQNRAVTLQDYADLALGVTAVSKASAFANSFTSVTVFILGPAGATATDALKDSVKLYMAPKQMAGTTVTVSNASVVSINVGSSGSPCTLGVSPNYQRSVVLAEVNKALQNYFLPTNVSFGQRVSLSDIYTVISQVQGVDYAIIPLLARSDAAQTGTNDVVLKAWEIPSAGNLIFNVQGGLG
jgi:hypothetical protein